MVFFVLLSKLPLIKPESPEDLVKQNKLNLALGAVLYLGLGGLILTKKLPLDQWLSFIPDKKYLIGIILLDILLYFLLYRFEYGFFPPFSLSSIPLPPLPPPPQRPPSKKPSPKHQDAAPPKLSPQKDPSIQELDEISSLGTQLHDDLDSYLKVPNQIKQPEEAPQEASLTGQNYFQENDNQTTVENWDLDEFTQEEYVPDHDDIDPVGSTSSQIQEDEMILEK